MLTFTTLGATLLYSVFLAQIFLWLDYLHDFFAIAQSRSQFLCIMIPVNIHGALYVPLHPLP